MDKQNQTPTTFSGTAEYYSRYRPGIPDEVEKLLVAQANRDAPANTLLDLGTGTGQVIEAIYSNFNDIIAVDSDADMLALAEKNLRAKLPPEINLQFYQSRAEDFSPPAGWAASLVTICRAFHWMDQALVLKRSADYVPQTGVVAIFSDSSFWENDTLWQRDVRRVIQNFLGEKRRQGPVYKRPFEDVLKESAFSQIEEFRIPVHRTWNTECILGYLYSTSFATRHLFGNKLNDFEAQIKLVLLKHSHEDTFHEENEFQLLFGRKK